MDQRQCALALVQVAENLLAIGSFVTDEVEQVVADLERRAEVESEPHERREIHGSAGPDDRAHRSGWIVVYQQVLCMMRLR